jgi:tetraacyldisaccharide 4'-kinase
LRRADAVVLVDRDDSDAAAPPLDLALPTFRMRLDAVALVESVERRWRERPIGQLAARRVIAVTGVARPEGFYAMLRRWEAVVQEVFEYPDHHRYSREDWQQIARRGHDADLIVTTEKDLVKLEAFPFATGKLVALRIAPQVQRAEDLISAILAAAGLQLHAAEEERNGHQ